MTQFASAGHIGFDIITLCSIELFLFQLFSEIAVWEFF